MSKCSWTKESFIPLPKQGRIVRLCSPSGIRDSIVARVGSTYCLVGLCDGNRWEEPGELCWDSLTGGQADKVTKIWADIEDWKSEGT